VPHTFDEVLLNASCSGDQHINHLVLHQPADLLPYACTNQVASVTQVYLGAARGPEGRVCMLRSCVSCDRIVLKPPVDLQDAGRDRRSSKKAAAREAAHIC
jgi:hypothetical protein